MKQEELATKMGLKKQTISGWETGRYQPQPTQLRELEKIFGTKYNGGSTVIRDNDVLIPIRGKVWASPFRLASPTNSIKSFKRDTAFHMMQEVSQLAGVPCKALRHLSSAGRATVL